ncbi:MULTISPECIES: TadE/TadG family type IV pilus assembly protein [unclassified Phaeobacter]|uniref:TadE/TadG family type IV pilus assembly protein n=1 Tax=unclassified Phaeobacter TaxID=2621772 RepID=UPI003A8A3E03
MLTNIRALFRRYRRETDGSVSVEFAFYMPLLLGVFAAIYTYFDAFRQEGVNLKAAYTISDLISRETSTLNEDYIDSMHELAKLLIRVDSSISLRISVIRWDETDNRYYVDWSKVRGGQFAEWQDATIQQVKANLPNMPDQERVILVETRNDIDPAFNIGLPAMDIENFVFTRPRFAPQVKFEGQDGSGGGHDDSTPSTD